MTKKKVGALSLVLLVILVSCEQKTTVYHHKTTVSKDTVNKKDTAVKVLGDTLLSDKPEALWLTPKAMTPFSFLEVMKKRKKPDNTPGVVTMTDNFPGDWIRKEDIAGLMKLINSQEKCSCFMNPFSSYIPRGNATIGGYAIAFVEAYKEKRKVSFGLHACPEVNKQKADALLKWWAGQKK